MQSYASASEKHSSSVNEQKGSDGRPLNVEQPESDRKNEVLDVMNESQFWRQQIDRSLHELSGAQRSGSASEIVSDEQSIGPVEKASAKAGTSKGLDNERTSEVAKSSSKPAFKRREADLTPTPKPGVAALPRRPAPLRVRPKVVEPLSAQDWEKMSKLLGMSVEELERNAAGTDMKFDEQAKGQGSQGAGQQPKKPGKPGALPPIVGHSPQEAVRRQAPVAMLRREPSTSQPKSSDRVDKSELMKLRQGLNKKLSEANMYNRHLQREISERDKAVEESTLYLAALQTELKALVEIAKEIAAGGPKPVTRKVNGRYIQSHLASRLEELSSQLDGQLRQVDAVRLREVPVTWLGMAEDVKVMGTFDGWTRGQHLSPETTGSYTLFSTVLQLRPGRYEVKFVVDGNWQLAPSWPVVGEGLSANNLLVVE